MRAIGVDENAMVIILVVGIAADMVAFLNNERGLATLSGGPFGEGKAGKTGANDKIVVFQFFLQSGTARIALIIN